MTSEEFMSVYGWQHPQYFNQSRQVDYNGNSEKGTKIIKFFYKEMLNNVPLFPEFVEKLKLCLENCNDLLMISEPGDENYIMYYFTNVT